ncbi:hypothetical protein PoB_003534700 [Plakobranchus ocellatus]|uniref:Uncharacterized protein n=1 Tax=Plakobranchus ocellatus TaxID=259542 RepID=A0AAV4ANJ1_9GAST|nr:hypothetical protein PoB_003534700 [Plakobranchus ocellatus]
MPERSPPVQNQNLSLSHVPDLSHEQANDSSLQLVVLLLEEFRLLLRMESFSGSFGRHHFIRKHSLYRCLGDVRCYQLPMTLPYLVIRDFGRHWLKF